METVLLMAVMGAVNLFCFVCGAKVGQKVSKGEEVEMPSVNPLEAIKKHREEKEAEHEQQKLNTILENIDNYDGSGWGQKDVPKG